MPGKGQNMIDIKKTITLEGNSKINEVIAETYRAVINHDNQDDMSMSRYQQNKQAYKENHVKCRKDAESFEEYAYALQEQMIKEKSAKDGEDQETATE